MEISFIPRWILKLLGIDEFIRYDVSVLVSNLLIVIVFFSFGNKLLELLSYLPHFCLFDRVFGFECPACGVTRAFCEFGDGKIGSGIQQNYAAILVGVFVVIQIPIRLIIILKQDTKIILQKISRIGSSIILALILLNWIRTLFLT
ncbi:DUF2752 domain-containing protein [Labilibaculum sp. DW002]|uniref:DUF2752 domain-containing protein n=1 Tax=Paralabilibaculum antarcticum TaxID=2912572 RepID=A0ABT5VRZ7_9BACT|nr:DUF2752 domain-containing protein [Labilibaculum sp. DW002]MDE5418204.1 DUF2752 domain-containing protein [Labilibaculum sp. DW002]